MKRYRKGKALQVIWKFYHTNGDPFNITNYTNRISYVNPRGQRPAASAVADATGADTNTLSWTIPANELNVAGIYNLRVKLTSQAASARAIEITYDNAFGILPTGLGQEDDDVVVGEQEIQDDVVAICTYAEYGVYSGISDLSEDVDDLADRMDEAEGDIDSLGTTVGGHTTTLAGLQSTKANKSEVYTKTESDARFGSKTDVDALKDKTSKIDYSDNDDELTFCAGNNVVDGNLDVTGNLSVGDHNDVESDLDTLQSQVTSILSAKADKSSTYTKTEVNTALASKQDKLTPGTGITIQGNTISATGGGGSVDAYTKAQTDSLLNAKVSKDSLQALSVLTYHYSPDGEYYESEDDYDNNVDIYAKGGAALVQIISEESEDVIESYFCDQVVDIIGDYNVSIIAHVVGDAGNTSGLVIKYDEEESAVTFTPFSNPNIVNQTLPSADQASARTHLNVYSKSEVNAMITTTLNTSI